MNQDRIVTYSLLANIRQETSIISGPLDIFKPLVKRALSKMNEAGKFSGKNILEIKSFTDEVCNIDFPVPVLKKILEAIANEINVSDCLKFAIHLDGSFRIRGYHFTELEELVSNYKREIQEVESLYVEFCKSQKFSSMGESIFDFIDSNRVSLSRYLANRVNGNERDFTPQAQFVDFFRKIPRVYEIIKGIYLGSIIVAYIEFKTEPIKEGIELLLDTNFLVGLLDLNTAESYHTCNTLLNIAKKRGYKISVLLDTIEETNFLLEAKAKYYNDSFLVKKIFTEDIYNACDRRNLNKADLERISDNLEQTIGENGISIVYNTMVHNVFRRQFCHNSVVCQSPFYF